MREPLRSSGPLGTPSSSPVKFCLVLTPSVMYLGPRASWELELKRSRWDEEGEGEVWASLQYYMRVLCK